MLRIKKIIEKSAQQFIRHIGYALNPILLNLSNEKHHILVFCFHGLYQSKEEKDLNHIDPQNNFTVNQFVAFIEYFIRCNYQFIQPRDLTPNLPPDQSYVMLTFDDGYYNNILSIDVINQYRIPVTFFIATHNVIYNKSYWWDVIYKYRINEGFSLAQIRDEQEILKNYKHDYIDEYIKSHFGAKSTTPWSDIDRPFSPAEIEQIAKDPLITIGNHTHRHAILTNYDRSEIMQEFNESNKILQNLTGKAPTSIAFPNGNYNELAMDIAAHSGFKYAFTTKSFSNKIPVANKSMITLDRIMPETMKISKLGGFYRLNYDPSSLYVRIVETVKSPMKNF